MHRSCLTQSGECGGCLCSGHISPPCSLPLPSATVFAQHTQGVHFLYTMLSLMLTLLPISLSSCSHETWLPFSSNPPLHYTLLPSGTLTVHTTLHCQNQRLSSPHSPQRALSFTQRSHHGPWPPLTLVKPPLLPTSLLPGLSLVEHSSQRALSNMKILHHCHHLLSPCQNLSPTALTPGLPQVTTASSAPIALVTSGKEL